MLHRHQGATQRGTFVMASLAAELAVGMSAPDLKAWFGGLLSLCGKHPPDETAGSRSKIEDDESRSRD